MSFIFADGFDDGQYNLGKYEGQSLTAGANTTITSSGRSGSAVQLAGNDFLTKFLAAADEHATLIVGFALKPSTLGSASENFLELRSDSAATQHVTFNLSIANQIEARRGSVSGTLLGTTTRSLPTRTQFYFIEVKVLLSATVGTVDVYVNGVNWLSLTAQNTKNAGTKTTFDSVRLVSGTGTTSRWFTFDDLYILNGAGASLNDVIGDIAIETLLPSAAGATTQLTATGTPGGASNWAYVDETTPNTTDYVGSSTSGQLDTYTFQDMVRTTGNIRAVQATMYGAKSDTGSRSLRALTRIGSTNYAGADQALANQSYNVFAERWAVKPSDSTAWTISDVNAAEFGAEVRP